MKAFLILMSASAIFMMIWLYIIRDRFSYRTYMIVPLSVIHVLYGIFTVKIFAFAESGMQAQSKGAMSLYGAVFFMPVLYRIYALLLKCRPATVFDTFTVGMIFTLICARVNCFISGCCLGKIVPGTQARWPTRELEILYYLILMEVMIFRIRKRKAKGELYPVYMISYGVFRFMLEFFRESGKTGIFHNAHYWSALSVLIGVIALLRVIHKNKKGV